jgi:catechol 2,3-dioxygenase-like lactoylglutathione lyase family enzyme
MSPLLVPELDVTDLNRSRSFYLDVLGFTMRYERDSEAFVYLAREGAELMLQASAAWRAASS